MQAPGSIVISPSAAIAPERWPDLVTLADPSWLQAAGLGDAHHSESLMSSPAARQVLRHHLADRLSISTISGGAASILQWLDKPCRTRRLVQQLTACAVVDQIRLCIDGALVRSLRLLLGEPFLGCLLGGNYRNGDVPLVLPAPALPTDSSDASIERFFLGMGKALLLGAAPASDDAIRTLICLSLPKQLESVSLGPGQVNQTAVLDCLAELSRND